MTNLENEKLFGSLLKIVNHILKSALAFKDKKESCIILIDESSLNCLALTLHLDKYDYTE